MKAKTKVLICVLSGIERTGWLNPQLTLNLLQMSRDPRFDVEIEMLLERPIDFARNKCVVMARSRKAEFLLMIDNDQNFGEFNALDVLHAGFFKDVIGLPSMQSVAPSVSENGFVPNVRTLGNPESHDGQFFTVERVGCGAMFINRKVWERVPGPWFKTCHKEGSETNEPEDAGEDFFFCDLARAHNFKIWIHSRMNPHLKTTDINLAGMRIQTLQQLASHAAQINTAAPAAPIRWNVQA